MSQPFANLFSPLQVGQYTLKNRIMNTGHAAHFQTGDGLPTTRYVDYVRERARGGAAIVVIGHAVPHHDGDTSLSLTSYDQRVVPVYAQMSDATHEHDVPLLAQLGHRGRRVSDGAAFLARPTLAPSAVPSPDFSTPQLMPHVMTTAEVEETVAQFVAAARRVVQGRLDGIELAVGMDYLFANFLNPTANLREDRYGGATLGERMTYLDEVVAAVRGELGRARILGVRFYDDLVDYSLSLEDYKQVAKLLEAGGQVDYFNMWQGLVPSPKSGRAHWPSHHYPPGHFTYLPAGLKTATTLPVVGAGRIDSPALAERIVAEGKADIIGMARTLIADPHFPNKAREGRTDDIRTCIACTQSCVGHIYMGMGVGCIYNPVTGREGEWATLNPARERKRVAVVGGGPAGMEAARICAERGHEVTLYERERRLGGQINLVMRTPNRESFEEIPRFLERQIAKLGVHVVLGTAVSADDLLTSAPDAIVVATGSTPFRPQIVGVDAAHVVSAREAIAGSAAIGERVLVIDTLGRAEAPTTAELLADQGRRVEIVTGLPYVGTEMPAPAWHPLMERLLDKGVTMTPFTGVWEIAPRSVEVYNVINWAPRTIEDVHTVVLAAGGRADDSLYAELSALSSSRPEGFPELHAIGDCFQPRDIEVATVEGHRIGRQI